ncbi:uncharacterized protein J4E79_010608 [Alternaria viburni]|uniref:uncharacterized protein n=1 Tax=Alternaria viburni TaxID=566460 RepID=UPI0020C2CAC6|nr:uncharacterized protein J4E79_010608 [Alternaria viburni]KAI4646100.1 hypothetical protein J4E79_010608 [Alternaria viburni]
MKLLATITFFSALAAAAPVLDARATTTAKTSSALKTSSAAAVIKSSSAVAVVTSKTSSALVVSKASSTPVASKASSAAPVVSSKASSAAAVSSRASSAAATTTTTAPLLGVNVGGSSSPLLGVKLSSATVLAVDASLGGSSAKASTSTITAAPTAASGTAPTALPSTFSAPVQGQGKLTLDNLPAMPGVIDKTFSGVLGAAYGLMSGACDASYRCNITVAGTIQNLLIDGSNYGTNTSVVAWCESGRCYGTASAPVTATAPFIITCDQLSGTQVCSATISGAANAIFQNGKSIELWGWATPAGYCQNGVCTASITAVGDPMY